MEKNVKLPKNKEVRNALIEKMLWKWLQIIDNTPDSTKRAKARAAYIRLIRKYPEAAGPYHTELRAYGVEAAQAVR